MKDKLMGVINLIHESDELEMLTSNRCLATVPFGARYRLIDFILSSMVNSGINKVGLFAHTKYRSILDHIGNGKNWDLQHRQSGLFIVPPSIDSVQELSRGDLYQFYQNRDYFTRSENEYVLIARSHTVCNIDFSKVLHYHMEKEADITVVCKRYDQIQMGKTRKVNMLEDGRIIEIQDDYGRLLSDIHSTEMYIMRRELLMDLVETSLAKGQDHLVRQAILSRINQLKVYGYLHQGYLGVVNTIESYYDNSMNLLKPEVWREIFFQPGSIFTKVKDEPPTRYMKSSSVSNSLIANGCIIEGEVRNSILFRGVHVHKGAMVENSIIMQNGIIRANSVVDYCILDKDVEVGQNRTICGVRSGPYLAAKRKVI